MSRPVTRPRQPGVPDPAPAPARRAWVEQIMGMPISIHLRGADVDGLALGHADLRERSRHRRRDLRVDLVGRHLEQRLVGADVLTDRLEPLRDRALGHGLTELGQGHFGHRVVPLLLGARSQPLKLRPVSVSTVSPNSSVRLGCGWMNSATSSTVASQFTAR